MKKLFFIFNPVSGKKVIHKKLAKIIDEFVKAGYEITIRTTQSGEDAVEQAAYACKQDYDKIIVAGGDGTLSQCFQGIMNSEKKLPIGYIPAGSTNDFAESLGIPTEQIKATKSIIHGKPVQCDIGGLNGVYFTYVVGFGAFTNLTYETPQNIKNVFGHPAYLAMAFPELRKLKSRRMRIEHDGEVLEDDYIVGLVTNASQAGGVLRFKEYTLNDGLFEVLLVRKPKDAAELKGVITALLKNDVTNKNMTFFRTDKLTVTNLSGEPVPWTRDGEYGGNADVNEICCYKRAVEFVLRSKGNPAFEKN